MEKLDSYIRSCNLLFTNTVNFHEFSQNNFDPSVVSIDYSNSINLHQLVSSFSSAYQAFLKDYNAIDKLDLGEDVTFTNYFNKENDNGYVSNLQLFIEDPVITKHDTTVLHIKDLNGKIESFVTSEGNPFSTEYYRDKVNFNENICKQYLELFYRYRLLVELYTHLRCNRIFGNGYCYMETRIDECEMNLLKGIDKFNLSFGIGYFNNVLNVIMDFSISHKLGLNYKDSEFNIDGKAIKPNEKDFQYLLNHVYINNDYIRSRKQGER